MCLRIGPGLMPFLVAMGPILYTRTRRGVMADKEQLDLITEDGVTAWNAWRTENPRVLTNLSEADLQACYLDSANFGDTNLQDAVLKGAHLAGANLTRANLSGADFSSADLTNAKLSGAKLAGINLAQANLTKTDLTGANFKDTNLTGANFQEAQLGDANFRGATLESAMFQRATFNQRALGLGRLPQGQRAAMREVQVEDIPEDTPQEPTQQAPDKSDNLTVGYAKRIVGPAHWALQSLAIPNDLTVEHRDLFVGLVGTVAELQRKLADIEDENRRLADENETLGNSIGQALPLWKKAFEEFVVKYAGGMGTQAARGTAFAAGFIAGALYNTLSPGEPGLSI